MQKKNYGVMFRKLFKITKSKAMKKLPQASLII